MSGDDDRDRAKRLRWLTVGKVLDDEGGAPEWPVDLDAVNALEFHLDRISHLLMSTGRWDLVELRGSLGAARLSVKRAIELVERIETLELAERERRVIALQRAQLDADGAQDVPDSIDGLIDAQIDPDT